MTRPSSFFVTVLWLPSRWLLTAILLAAPTGYTMLLAQDEPRGALELASTSHAATSPESRARQLNVENGHRSHHRGDGDGHAT